MNYQTCSACKDIRTPGDQRRFGIALVLDAGQRKWFQLWRELLRTTLAKKESRRP
jgi:hypothetical protein